MSARITPIRLPQSMIHDALSGKAIHLYEPIAPWNSTINGYKPDAENSSEYGDGWAQLKWPEAWQDGSESRLEGAEVLNYFGAGRNPGQSCGKYLHVPWSAHGGASRVRSKTEPGDIFWVGEKWRPERHAKSQELEIHYGDGSSIKTIDRIKGRHLPGDEWKSSSSMPEWASRLRLKVTSVWPEMVRDEPIAILAAFTRGVSWVTPSTEIATAAKWLRNHHSGSKPPASPPSEWITKPWVWVRELSLLSRDQGGNQRIAPGPPLPGRPISIRLFRNFLITKGYSLLDASRCAGHLADYLNSLEPNEPPLDEKTTDSGHQLATEEDE